MTAPSDPRPAYAAATTWVFELLSAVSDDQLDSPTPCEDFDVQTLAAHLVATANKAVALGSGADALALPSFADRHDAAAYVETVGRAVEVWSDDSTLARTVKVPWGEVPGAAALWGYVSETLVHGWDLAVATGQPAEADPTIVEPVLAVARQFIPAEIREDDAVPFGAVVESRAEAGPTERLANWTGRESSKWVSAVA
ncbi:TIGR03086 family metal-binding protein [Gordonia sp. PKS22-38]|uniref:TIGR03086 family metal-binding protein n=1 Tax=Gordonia prachuapensis TaxID=3115651 RepID=A0ABU7MPD1_9ACTN|nr:TIGR03086 family metal-binding protein [Gordonia sp. PKS22-38]